MSRCILCVYKALYIQLMVLNQLISFFCWFFFLLVFSPELSSLGRSKPWAKLFFFLPPIQVHKVSWRSEMTHGVIARQFYLLSLKLRLQTLSYRAFLLQLILSLSRNFSSLLTGLPSTWMSPHVNMSANVLIILKLVLLVLVYVVSIKVFSLFSKALDDYFLEDQSLWTSVHPSTQSTQYHC